MLLRGCKHTIMSPGGFDAETLPVSIRSKITWMAFIFRLVEQRSIICTDQGPFTDASSTQVVRPIRLLGSGAMDAILIRRRTISAFFNGNNCINVLFVQYFVDESDKYLSYNKYTVPKISSLECLKIISMHKYCPNIHMTSINLLILILNKACLLIGWVHPKYLLYM